MSVVQFIFVLFLVNVMVTQAFQFDGAMLTTNLMELEKISKESATKGKNLAIKVQKFKDKNCSSESGIPVTFNVDRDNLECRNGNTLHNIVLIDNKTGKITWIITKSGECHEVTFHDEMMQPVTVSVKHTWSGWCDGEKLPGYAIALIVISVIVCVCGIGAMIYCFCFRNQKRQRPQYPYGQQQQQPYGQQQQSYGQQKVQIQKVGQKV